MAQISLLLSLPILSLFLFLFPLSYSQTLPINVWPKPTTISWPIPRATPLSPSFKILSPYTNHHLHSAVARYTGLLLSENYHPIVPPTVNLSSSPPLRSLTLSISDLSSPLQHGVDESYSLSIPSSTGLANLTAVTVWGAMRGLETFSQLSWGSDPPVIAADVYIADRPIFPYRGVLVDTSRNYYPVEDIMRTIEAMGANKLNVFHWHITDSHSFPIVLPSEPELAQKGSYGPGMRYTPEDVKAIVEFGMSHGVRVLPEIDTPAIKGQETTQSPTERAYSVAQECLDRLSIAVGGNTIVPVASELLPAYLSAPEWQKHHAALITLAQIAEGCSKVMIKNLEQVVNMVLNSFQDPHPRVRWAAINAIGQLSTDLGPDLQVQYHQRAHAASAVLNFSENCTPDILTPYLDGIVSKLLVLLQNGKQMVQEGALTALASVADSSQEQFQKYYDAVMPYLKAIFMNATDKSKRMVRAKSMECISLVGMAVGKEKFREDAKQVMEVLMTLQGSQMETDDPITSYMLQSAQLKPDVTITSADSDEEIDESDDDRYYDTYLPFLLEACNDENVDVRQAAVYGVGVCAEFGGSVFRPLVGEALSRLNNVIRHPDALHSDNVMAYDNAVSALGKICQFHRDSIDAAQVVPAWLSCLPIKGDLIEAKVVHDQLCSMVERSDKELLGPNNQYLPKIISVFAEMENGLIFDMESSNDASYHEWFTLVYMKNVARASSSISREWKQMLKIMAFSCNRRIISDYREWHLCNEKMEGANFDF
ncbi:hypothetical protein COCNU_06G014200 [Cocos nucifera]|uniref:beta-N-acetylhexosaminidase n=1 Tax=Cocos nucifera TaxID=13894 RepID=A0A8K0IC94_COCNU|nr:hypothetical protein COCNU_06G014200 [Cocos nucifera]